MARDYRTLKLEILAETKQFVADMKKSETQVEGFGGKLEKFGKVAAAAFAAAAAAAAAYAGKLAIDGVKAAIADQAAQERLANALRNVTGATNAQIATVEQQISKMSLSFGVADEQLRPAFQRLATATGDLGKANEGLSLALDISAATGKSVEQVANALGKAYEGNTGALGRLGIGLSSADIKALGLDGTMNKLAETFGGAAAAQANTLEGQIDRLKVKFDETKEAVGAGLLPMVQNFVDYIVNDFIPLLEQAKNKAVDPIIKAFRDNESALRDLWAFTKNYLVPLFEFTLVRAIEGVGKAIASIINIVGTVVTAVEGLVNNVISKINQILAAYNKLPFADIPLIPGVGGPTGFGNRPFGRTGGGGGGPTGGGTEDWVSPTGGGGAGGGKSLTEISGGLVNSPIDLINKLQKTSERLSEIQFLIDTGQINKDKGRELLRQTTAEFRKLESIGNAFQDQNRTPVAMGGQNRGENRNPTIVVNVNSPSVIDEAGFGRAVVDALNSLERRQAGGASALIGL